MGNNNRAKPTQTKAKDATKDKDGVDLERHPDENEIVVDGDAEENEDGAADASAEDDGETETVVGEEDDEAEEELQEAKVTKSGISPDPEVLAKAQAKAKAEPATQVIGAEKVPHELGDADEMSDHVLDSPQAFGFWIGGELHQFKKGKTRLTNKQKHACLTHPYVRDNGASVLKLVNKSAKK